MTTALASAGALYRRLGAGAMDARQFHHANPVTPFVDVIDLCANDDVMKQEALSISPREPGVSPRHAGISPRPAAAGGDEATAFVSYRLDQDDSGGSSAGGGVQMTGFDAADPDVTAAAELCLSDAVRLFQRTGSPSEPDCFPPLAIRPGSGARPSPGKCKVCGDEATGMYFGALVCVPCKTFFLRYAGDGFSFVCKANKDCDISVSTRTQCKYCRYQKCLRAGMYRRVRPAQVQLSAGQQLCVVCHDVANGIHFGAITCEGCKKFFRRGLTEHATYVCKSGQNCVINPRTRNSCRYCRFQTCLRAGMSREAIQMGRPSKICGSDAGMTSPHHQQVQLVGQSPSPSVVPGAGGYLGAATLSHAAGSWRDDRLMGLHHDWTVDQRRSSDTWSAEFSDSGTGGLLTDDAASLEPSPKRRHSDSYASSSPYQFSPTPSAGGSSLDLGHAGGSSGSGDGSHRSRQSSMSSQEAAAAYHAGAGGLWCANPPSSTVSAVGPSYGILRMSGGDVIQRVPAGAGASTPHDHYMHWNMPLPTTTTTVKLEDRVGVDVHEAFQAREMSDVIENIIRQQQQQQHPTATHSLAELAFSLHHHQQQQQQGSLASAVVGQSAVATTGTVNSLQSLVGPATDLTPDFISSLPPITVAATRPTDAAGSASSPTVDASDWIKQLPDDLSSDTPAAGLTSCLSDEEPDPEIEAQVQAAMNYWLHPDLPDENVMLAERHWDILNRVVPAYNSFVQLGTNVNRKLKSKFDEWIKDHPNVNKQERSDWIQSEVIPVYTLSSISYFKSLPGFNELSAADQGTLIRLGQSQSRILVAALHWYDPEENDFRHFLSWRIMPPGQLDHFRQKLIDYSKRVSVLELDPIEAALLNVLAIIASDYQGLEGTALIEEHRRQILCTFRAYTTAKFGTPNTRLETLFKYIPDVRRLGLWHYKMTTDPSLGVAQQQQSS